VYINSDWWNPYFIHNVTDTSQTYEIRVYLTATSKTINRLIQAFVHPASSGCSNPYENKAVFANKNNANVLYGTYTANATTIVSVYSPQVNSYAVRVCEGSCQNNVCIDEYCGGNGLCNVISGKCDCINGWSGDACDQKLPSPTSCPNGCNEKWGQGACNSTTGTCTCFSGRMGGFTGEDCSIIDTSVLDWTAIECKKGKYIPMLQPGLSGAELPFCVCPPGWEGLDCSICSTDDACSTPYNLDGTCDRSFNFSASLSTEKAFDCNITDVDFILLLDSVPQMPFHYFGNNNSATMQLFLKPTGPPVLFTCELTECTYETSLSMQKLNCNLTSCVCSTWCSSMLADIVASITSTSTLTCDNSSQECTYYQREMSTYTNSLQMACDTSSCV